MDGQILSSAQGRSLSSQATFRPAMMTGTKEAPELSVLRGDAESPGPLKLGS